MPPPAVFLILIGSSVILTFIYLYYGKKIAGINVYDYIKEIFIKASIPVILSVFISVIPMLTMEESFLRLVTTFVVSAVASLILIRLLGLTQDEFIKIKGVFNDGFKKIGRVAVNQKRNSKF